MQFLPITLGNVNNAATIFVSIANKKPWSGEWTYSSAYARLFTIAKSTGFTGYITMDNNGLPCGFVMGNTKNRADGGTDFVISEMSYTNDDSGHMYAKKTIDFLEEQLRTRHISRIIYLEEANSNILAYFRSLDFHPIENIVAVEKKLD